MRVFTNGVFDILHPGHMELLKFCRENFENSHVTVGINSDLSVKRLKGQSRPVNTQSDRARMLRYLSFVDDVVIFDADDPLDVIMSLKPDVIVKGGDYDVQSVIGNTVCKVEIFKFIDGYSSSEIIGKILDSKG